MNQITEYRPLSLGKIPQEGCYVLTTFAPRQVLASSPAVEVMTDLSKVPSATITADAYIQDAHQLLIARGVRMLIVIDPSNKISGLITTNDILGEKPVLAAQRAGIKRSLLRVGDVMTNEHELETLHLRDVHKALVGDIVATLREVGRVHALVVDDFEEGHRQKLVGIFSATQIARQMGIQIQTFETAKTFAEIETVIAGH